MLLLAFGSQRTKTKFCRGCFLQITIPDSFYRIIINRYTILDFLATDTGLSSFGVPVDIGWQFAGVCGDYGPHHLNWVTAKLVGYNKAMAHGMWTLSRSLSCILNGTKLTLIHVTHAHCHAMTCTLTHMHTVTHAHCHTMHTHTDTHIYTLTLQRRIQGATGCFSPSPFGSNGCERLCHTLYYW